MRFIFNLKYWGQSTVTDIINFSKNWYYCQFGVFELLNCVRFNKERILSTFQLNHHNPTSTTRQGSCTGLVNLRVGPWPQSGKVSEDNRSSVNQGRPTISFTSGIDPSMEGCCRHKVPFPRVLILPTIFWSLTQLRQSRETD